MQAAASSQPPRKRFRRSGASSVLSLSVPSARVQEIPLTAEIIDTIVQRVTDAVTQRLANGASSDNSQSLAFSASTQQANTAATPGLAPGWGPTQLNTTSLSCWPSYHSSTSTRSITGSILFIPICWSCRQQFPGHHTS